MSKVRQPVKSDLAKKLGSAALDADEAGDKEIAANLRQLADRADDPHYNLTRAAQRIGSELETFLYDNSHKLGDEARTLRAIRDRFAVELKAFGYKEIHDD
jgi:hypothetical protein